MLPSAGRSARISSETIATAASCSLARRFATSSPIAGHARLASNLAARLRSEGTGSSSSVARVAVISSPMRSPLRSIRSTCSTAKPRKVGSSSPRSRCTRSCRAARSIPSSSSASAERSRAAVRSARSSITTRSRSDWARRSVSASARSSQVRSRASKPPSCSHQVRHASWSSPKGSWLSDSSERNAAARISGASFRAGSITSSSASAEGREGRRPSASIATRRNSTLLPGSTATAATRASMPTPV